MSIEPDISLILPAFNEAATIRRTIEQARQYFSDRGLRFEIIVAADVPASTGALGMGTFSGPTVPGAGAAVSVPSVDSGR